MKKKTTPKVRSAAKAAGESIRSWRILYELKAEQVAQRAGISLGTFSKIENGDPSVGLDAFLEVVRSLGLLDRFEQSLDPLETDLGRARMTDTMPKRVR
jgi:transcriptional regulator with XRE-family HTH domain